MCKSKGLKIKENTPEEEQSGKCELRWLIFSEIDKSIKQKRESTKRPTYLQNFDI